MPEHLHSSVVVVFSVGGALQPRKNNLVREILRAYIQMTQAIKSVTLNGMVSCKCVDKELMEVVRGRKLYRDWNYGG